VGKRPQNIAHGARMRISSNSYANGANQNSGNFITDRSSTRIHAPPGGRSSFSLGWG
jgi:SPIRAL1-like protein